MGHLWQLEFSIQNTLRNIVAKTTKPHRHIEDSNLYTVMTSESPTRYRYNIFYQPNILGLELINIPQFNYIVTNHIDRNP